MAAPSTLTARPRRLRGTPAMRRLVAETRIHPAELILPMFIREGINEVVPIALPRLLPSRAERGG
jgi:delta-aminolevulinic acid dehydratase/porphobilinogen synthase